MKFANYYSLVFSVFFLFVLLAPTIVLLNSDKETFSVEVILEETEKKDVEDIKEFVELDFDKTNVLPQRCGSARLTKLYISWRTPGW